MPLPSPPAHPPRSEVTAVAAAPAVPPSTAISSGPPAPPGPPKLPPAPPPSPVGAVGALHSGEFAAGPTVLVERLLETSREPAMVTLVTPTNTSGRLPRAAKIALGAIAIASAAITHMPSIEVHAASFVVSNVVGCVAANAPLGCCGKHTWTMPVP